MMRKTKGWTGLRNAVIALGLIAGSSQLAKADQMPTPANLLNYHVAGAIGTTGITGENVVSFVPIVDAAIDPTSNIPLGSFQVAPLPVGETTTYSNTPFTLTFVPTAFSGNTLNETPLSLSGTLNGMLSGPYQSSVQVSFNPIMQNGFSLTSGSTSTLGLLPNDEKLLVPSSAGGNTTLEGQIVSSGLPTPSPEPSTIALFLSMVGGLGLRKYVQGRRQQARA
jgi:hypothetical protein